MICPCETCKYKTETKRDHRVFLGCSDAEKRKGFKYDDFFYWHSCDNYESEAQEE